MRDDSIRKWSVGFTLIGFVDSLYLTWIKLANAEAVCAGIGDCDAVNKSTYSEIYGIPIALLGAVAYAVILFLLIWEGKNEWIHENGIFGVFGLTLFGTIYSIYLTYIELFVLKAVCPYCVLSAVVLLILLIFAIIRIALRYND